MRESDTEESEDEKERIAVVDGGEEDSDEVEIEDGETKEEEEDLRSDEEEGEELREEEREGREKKIKLNENYALKHKEDDRKKKLKILSRAGKANSKKWGRSYNVEDVDTGEVYWLNLDEWEVEN